MVDVEADERVVGRDPDGAGEIIDREIAGVDDVGRKIGGIEGGTGCGEVDQLFPGQDPDAFIDVEAECLHVIRRLPLKKSLPVAAHVQKRVLGSDPDAAVVGIERERHRMIERRGDRAQIHAELQSAGFAEIEQIGVVQRPHRTILRIDGQGPGGIVERNDGCDLVGGRVDAA